MMSPNTTSEGNLGKNGSIEENNVLELTDDEEYEDIEEYIILDFMDPSMKIDLDNLNLVFTDLETPHPTVEIGNRAHTAYWTTSEGTSLVFATPAKKTTETAFDSELTTPTLVCKTFKHLCVSSSVASVLKRQRQMKREALQDSNVKNPDVG